MTPSIEVKKETEAKLSEANANEKYLYSRVTELEKRNQKLEKKVKKLKRKKKELKQEVAKLRGQIQSHGSEGVEGQDKDQGVSQMISPPTSIGMNWIFQIWIYCNQILDSEYPNLILASGASSFFAKNFGSVIASGILFNPKTVKSQIQGGIYLSEEKSE